jgi:hypothetical protein
MTSITPSIAYANVIASRIKIMSGLDISERRLPQDGRFKIRMNGSYVDFRVSTFPGIFGEKVVLHLLDKSNLDGLVKSPKIPFSVIPADPGSSPGGIQSFQAVADHLDSGFHRSDDFLRVHQESIDN